MRRWWHAEHDWETTEAEVDLRVGGAVRVVMRNPHEDVEYGGGGRYTEIDPPDPPGLHLDLGRQRHAAADRARLRGDRRRHHGPLHPQRPVGRGGRALARGRLERRVRQPRARARAGVGRAPGGARYRGIGADRDLERELGQAAHAAAAAVAGRAAARRGVPAGDQARRRGVRRRCSATSSRSAATRSRRTARRRGTAWRSSRASGSTTWSPGSPARRASRIRRRARCRRRAAGSAWSRSTCRTGASPTPSTTGTSSRGWRRCASWSPPGPRRRSSAAT